jgi:hypothetical protein
MKYFSVLNSFEAYQCEQTHERITVLGKRAVRMNHSRSEQLFYTKPFPVEFLRNFDDKKEHWVKLIKNPVKIPNYLWPDDIVDLSGNALKQKYALLFPFRDDLGGYVTIRDSLSNRTMSPDINIEASITLAKNLINAWCEFDSSRYLYHEFSFNNMFCNMDNEVMFDFSFSTQEYKDLSDGARVAMTKIHPDYTDVYYYQRKAFVVDVISNYFSMALILFRLLIGLLPYQGRLLEGFHNITKQDHAEWIKQYHKNPIFIFDEKEDVNRISSTTANPERYTERWEQLTPSMRKMFSAVFRTDNALRTIPPVFYTPHDWKNAIS